MFWERGIVRGCHGGLVYSTMGIMEQWECSGKGECCSAEEPDRQSGELGERRRWPLSPGEAGDSRMRRRG